MDNKLTTILVVYNEPISFVRIQIDSILNQTYDDFKFIIISDNPSNSELNDLIKEYEKKDKRIYVIINEQNLGIPKAKNVGLAISASEYIAISDADDYCHPERFEKQIKYLDTHPEVVAVGGYALIMNENGRIIDEMHTSNNDKQMKSMLPFEQPIYHPLMMYRRIINGNPVRYNERMRISLDYELCNQFSCGVFANIPEYLLCYRYSHNQTTQKYKDKYLYYDAPIRKNALFKYYSGISDQDAEAFINMYYLQQIDKAKIKEVETFILHLYYNNEKNQNVYIDPAMVFILIRYIKFLRVNGSWMFTLQNFININNKLGNRFYGMVIGHILNKVTTIVKYRILNKRCSI